MTSISSSLSPEDIVNKFWLDRGAANMVLSGGGAITLTANRELRWTQRFIAMGGGTSEQSQDGFFNITMPPVGTVITGTQGAASVTVTASGITFPADWDSLWYELPSNRQAATNNENFKLVRYVGLENTPSNWVFVAGWNPETLRMKLGTNEWMTANTVASVRAATRFGGEIQAASTVGGVIPTGYNSYQDFDGNFQGTVTLPTAGRFVGDTFTLSHLATFPANIQIANTDLAVPLTMNSTNKGAAFIWNGTKWMLMSSSDASVGVTTILAQEVVASADVVIGSPIPAGARVINAGSVNIATAVGLDASGTDARLRLTFTTALANADYMVQMDQISVVPANWSGDNEVYWSVVSKSATGFDVASKRISGSTPNINLQIKVIKARSITIPA